MSAILWIQIVSTHRKPWDGGEHDGSSCSDPLGGNVVSAYISAIYGPQIAKTSLALIHIHFVKDKYDRSTEHALVQYVDQ